MDKLEKRRQYYATKKEHIRLKQYEWSEKNSRPKNKGVPGIFKTKYPVYNYYSQIFTFLENIEKINKQSMFKFILKKYYIFKDIFII